MQVTIFERCSTWSLCACQLKTQASSFDKIVIFALEAVPGLLTKKQPERSEDVSKMNALATENWLLSVFVICKICYGSLFSIRKPSNRCTYGARSMVLWRAQNVRLQYSNVYRSKWFLHSL